MSATALSTSRRRQVGRLPSEVTSFVGRRREMADVKQFLSESRMVTLTGTGGIGKTRLAMQVAADVRRAFPDGVWLVELAALDSPELLVQTVIESLEICDHSSRPPMEVLVEHLRDKQALVILDNCEHLLHDCAMLADTLLRSAPHLRILATSRQALGIAGEQTLTVPTLSLPDSDATGMSERCDAVRLFAKRAGAVLPGFTVTESNRDAVEGICRRLDGLPLGIELAAVRLQALSAQQLLDRLDDHFRLLTTGPRNVSPRHRTLRGLIDWSYALCTDQERLLWERVSVFAGGLDLEAAEAVCSGDGIAREEVLDLVAGLVDKSILSREEHSPAVRYRLLETIRQYGRERLVASGQEAALRRRHRDHYRGLAAEAYAQRFGPTQVAWLTRLDLEHANLRAALEYCFTEPAEARTGLDMAADLLYHWVAGYYLREGRHWLDHGLAADTEPSEVRARALWTDSWLAIIQDDIASAAAMLEESRAIGERLGHEQVLAYVALYCGVVAMYRRDAESALALYEEAVARHRATGDLTGLALALIRLALAHSFYGAAPRAVSVGEECLAMCDAHEEGWHRAYAAMALGIEVWRRGDTRHAAELVKEGLRFNRSLDDPLGVGIKLEVLAWIAASEGQYQRAAGLLGILQRIRQTVNVSIYMYAPRCHEECESRTRRALGESAFHTTVKRGAGLSYDEALAYALEEDTPGDGRPEEAGRPSPLTRREMEVARLVAQGLSNKEIAASLVIARRTAEGHVEHILTKLDFNSRAQIAVWVSEQSRAAGDEPPPGGLR
ncbi:ATP-binding protein [Nonomuraea sp. NPDC059194]|uniref:ATP-binding protein n=1 Tax=Nonomuraea sp. NPDC059194 TaxID=3346764 RepID=UPI00369B32AF